MPGGQILHGRHEGAPLAAFALEHFQLASQRDGLRILLAVDHFPDQIDHLLNAAGILFEELPDQGLSLCQAICR